MSTPTEQPEERGLLQDFEQAIQQEPATRGQRFVNLLIDSIFMQFVLSYATDAIVVYFAQSYFTGSESADENFWTIFLLSYLAALTNRMLYYTICEKAFKGRTLGKLCSRTRAIRNDGQELTFRDALLRSLCRLVPFEEFSGFGRPWHDTWTRTQVVKVR